MAEQQKSSAPAEQPSADQLLKALEKAHLAGDTGAARELAAWHQELYKPAPEPEPPGMIERGANALRSLVSGGGESQDGVMTQEQSQAASRVADFGRRGPAPQQAPAQAPAAPPPDARRAPAEPAPTDAFTGAAQEAPEEAPNLNAGRGALERAGDLGAGALTAIGAAAESAENAMPLGGFVWEEGKALPSYKSPEKYAEYREGGGQETLSVAADQLRDLDAGYVPDNTWESVKQEFGENGALSGSAWGEVLAYGAEQGVQSIPDMVAATLSIPAYVLARSGEMGTARAENKGKEDAELTDVLEAAPFALGSAILERIGAKGITRVGAENVGKEALKRGVGYAAARTAQEGGGAALKEAGTEFVQEGVIEYVGERFGTDAAMSFAEAAEMGAAGAVAGGVYGGAAGTATAGTREATRRSPEAELGRAMQQEADSAQFVGDPAREATERLAPENAQMQQVEPGTAATPNRKSMADLVREKLEARGIAQPQPESTATPDVTPAFEDEQDGNAAWVEAWKDQGMEDPEADLPDTTVDIEGEPELANERAGEAQASTPADGTNQGEQSPEQPQAERREASPTDESLNDRMERLGFSKRLADEGGSPILTDPNGVELGTANFDRAKRLMDLWEQGERDLEDAPDTKQAANIEPRRRNQPIEYTGYSGQERQARSYDEVGDYRIAKVHSGLYEVIDSQGQAVSQRAGRRGAAEYARQLQQEGPSEVETGIEQAAAETDITPSEAQAEAGNYRKGRVRLQGMDISIENPRGSTRRGTDPDGNQWESQMAHHYGDIKGTTAADGDNLDVFIGPNPDADQVFVIDQVNDDGSFDEHKVMMGFDTQQAARQGYLDNYEDGWQGLGAITATNTEGFKSWVDRGDHSKPWSRRVRREAQRQESAEGGQSQPDGQDDTSAMRTPAAMPDNQVTAEQAEADLLAQMDEGDRELLTDDEWQQAVEDQRQRMQRGEDAAASLPEGFDAFGDFSFDGETLSRGGEPVGTASMRVADDGVRRLVVDDIRMRQRGQGAGTEAIQAIVEQAREQGLPVALTAESMQGRQTQQRLRDYYQRLGFTRNQGADRVRGIAEEFYLAPEGVTLPRANRQRRDQDTSAMQAPATPMARGEQMAAHASPWAPSPATPTADSDVSSLGQDMPMPNWRPTYGMMGVNPRRPASGEFQIGDRTIKLKPEDDPTRREGIRVMVTDLIGPRLYQGKVQGKTRLGFYRSSTSEVRIANFDDVEVMAHELAHYLDMHYDQNQRFTNAYRDPAVRSEVEQLSYTSDPKAVGKEGFAEFVRLWLTQYDEANSRAPQFTEKFEALLKRDKKLQRKMTRMQEEMHRWYQQGDLAQAYAVTSGNEYTPGQQATLLLARRPGELWRQHYIDKIHAAKVMGRTTSGGLRDASVDAYKQLQLLNGVEGIAQESFKMGALTITPEGDIAFNGPSLRDVWQTSLKSGPKMLREQELYFVARRAQELKGQGRENLISNGMIQEGLAMAKKHPHFEKAFSDYQAYRKNMMEFYVQSGYVTPDAAKAMLEANKNYVPFHRIVESVNSAYTSGGAGFQRLTGGQQNIKPVYDNMMMQEQRHIYAALKARALRSLYQDALKSQDGSLFLSKISPDSKPVKAAVDQMASKTAGALADLGVSISSNGQITGNSETVVDRADIESYFEQNQEELMFWTFGHKPKTTETMVDSFIDGNGKRVWIEIQKENQLLVDMLDNMDYIALPEGAWGTAVKLAMRVKNFQTLTITSMAQFVGPNLVRDAQQAWMLSGGRFRPGWDTMKGLGAQLHSLVSQKGAWHEMKAQGGPAAGRVRTFYHENWGLASDVAYKPRQPYYHPAQWANAFLDVYMALADSAEIATRLGFYMRQREVVGAREAAWQAREISTDFRKHGTYAPWVLLQRTVPFLGAYVQSVDRDIRALAENKGEMKLANLVKTAEGRATLNDIKVRIWMVGGLIITATAMLALLNDDEERYRALTPDQKTRFYNFFIGGKHYTLPKPHGFISLMAQGAESAMDTLGRQENSDAWKTMTFAIGYHFGGDAMPGVLNPVAEVALNKTFTGAPVVSRYAQDREERYQYTDRTPQIYINAGRALNVSPDKARHLVRGYTGYLSDFIDEYSEKLLWDDIEWGERPFARDFSDMMSKQFKPREVAYRTKWTTGYYELRRRAATAQANLSFLKNSEALRDQQPLEEFASDRVNTTLLGINRAFSRIDSAFQDQDKVIASIKYDPALTAEQKETQIEAYYEQKNDALGSFYRDVSEELERVEEELPDI